MDITNYDYDKLCRDIDAIQSRFAFVDVQTIGHSVRCREIHALRIGKGNFEVYVNAVHHAMEWITAPLTVKFIYDCAAALMDGTTLFGRDVCGIFDNASLYITPMVNPDGVQLFLHDGGDRYKRWQSNANGVDLNHNYDADFAKSKKLEKMLGVFGPGSTRYGGRRPESEPETKAVANFTRNHDFKYVIALHSQGEVIYWKYKDIVPVNTQRIARHLTQVSGYSLDETTGIASCSGYKDWFIDCFRRPGFTVEVGKGTNPLPISQFDEIYSRVAPMFIPLL